MRRVGVGRHAIASIALIVVSVVAGCGTADVPEPPPNTAPPPQGYLSELVPPGSAATLHELLPDDEEAAAMVHRSTWEIRPENADYNATRPEQLVLVPADVASGAFDPRWNTEILGRVTGNFTGTTDEIFQWAAAKWGLPDNLLRVIAYLESDWEQATEGDEVDDQALCPPGYEARCPVTFGIVGTKSTSWPGIFPWNRDSTAAGVDMLGGWLRGCYEGWAWWLRNTTDEASGDYAAGDIWGCVGAWYSGKWHDGQPGVQSGEDYLQRAKESLALRPWLDPEF